MPRLTKAQRAKGAKLWKVCDAAHTAIFQGEQNVPWSEAYRNAPATLRAAYEDASRNLREYEREMTLEGRGWIDSRGYFAETGSYGSPWF